MFKAENIPRWFFGLAVAITLGLVWINYELEVEDLESRFLFQTRMIAKSIEPDLYQELKGVPEDQQTVAYQRIKQHLKRLTRHYPDIHFSYLYALRPNGQVVFLVDNEPEGTSSEVTPGVLYEEIDPRVLAILKSGAPGISPAYTDRWGTWVSAIIPIENHPDVDLQFFFISDVDAKKWHQLIMQSMKWPLLVGGLALLVLLVRWTLKHWYLKRTGSQNTTHLAAFFLVASLLVILLVWMIHRMELQKESDLFRNVVENKSLRALNSIRQLEKGFFYPLAREIALSDQNPLAAFEEAMSAYELPPLLDVVGWIEQVPADRVASLVREMRRKDPRFEIWETNAKGERQPSISDKKFFPVLRVLPGTGEPHPARGFDEWSEPNRRAAIQQALLTNELSLSAPVALVYLFDQGGNLTCFYPARNPEDGELIGLIVAGLITEQLLAQFHYLPGIESVRDAADEILFFEREGTLLAIASTVGQEESPASQVHSFSLVSESIAKPIHLGGQTLVLKMSPGTLFQHHYYPWISWMVGMLAGLATLASTLGLSFLFRHRERLEAEVLTRTRELRESEAQFRQLFEESSEAYVWAKGDTLFHCNRSLCKMLRCHQDDLIDKSPLDFSPEYQPDGSPSRSKAEYHLNTVMREGHHCFEWQHLRMDGSLFWTEINMSRLDCEDGPLIFSSVRDITQRKQAQEDNNRLRTAVEQADEVVVITDAEGSIQYVNPAFERTTGYRRDEALGQNSRILKSGQHPKSFYEEMWKTLSEGKRWEGRLVNQDKNGKCFTEQATISPVRDDSGKITNFIAVKRNISRELELEHQFQQSQKMETVGQLAGGVAHDFNNVLQAILGYASLAMGRLQGHPATEDLEEILKAAKQASGVTRQLLSFSRQNPAQFKPVNLNKVVEGMLKIIGRLLEEHIDIQVSLARNLPVTQADSVQLEQILLNLCINARDAMADGGSIHIRTGKVKDSRPICEKHQLDNTELIYFSVGDTGKGIPESDLEKIFEPFFTSKKEGQGTGLGLASVYGIVQQHKGAIEVESQQGEGTTMTVYLPIIAPVEKPAAAPTSGKALHHGNSGTILLADDYELILNLTRRILEQAGYRVLTAQDGKSAAELIQKHGAEIDLVVSDLIMPNGGGREVLKMARECFPEMPFLFISGYDPQSTETASEDDPIQILQKPFEPEKLLETIARILKESGWPRPQ